jgi:hypothetical protein
MRVSILRFITNCPEQSCKDRGTSSSVNDYAGAPFARIVSISFAFVAFLFHYFDSRQFISAKLAFSSHSYAKLYASSCSNVDRSGAKACTTPQTLRMPCMFGPIKNTSSTGSYQNQHHITIPCVTGFAAHQFAQGFRRHNQARIVVYCNTQWPLEQQYSYSGRIQGRRQE